MALKGAFGEDIFLVEKFPEKKFSKASTIFFVDQVLQNHSALSKLKGFKVIYVKAGEDLKSLSSLQNILPKVQTLSMDLNPPLTFVCIGGGSVGDFVGFLASVYHRGVNYVQVPSTWLASIDSAHGGKTALNVDQYKNQIGTFYPASQIIICKSLLKNLPPQTAIGEVLKTILLAPSTSSLKKILLQKKPVDSKWLLSNLKKLIQIKNIIVKKDPYEKKEIRYKLNLGHTVGHAIEHLTSLSHSESVTWGLLFSMQWSLNKKYISLKQMDQVLNFLRDEKFNFSKPQFTKEQFKQALLKDKKRKSNKIKFVFCKKAQVVVEAVKVDDILDQLKNQGYINGI